MPHLFSTFLTSVGISVGFSWVVLKIFPKLKLLDKPHKYGLKRDPIPYPGGLAIVAAFCVLVISFLDLDKTLTCFLIAAILIAATSFIDDRMSLPPWVRLLVQFIAGIILVFGGISISSITNPFGGSINLLNFQIPISLGEFSFTFHLFADLVTILWIMVMVNSFNWIDGVPGMTSSVSAVSALVLLLLSLRPGFHYIDQTQAITLSTIIFAVSLGFLIFDFPKPKILMGDTGSMILGFFLAVTAIISGAKIATTILVLGFPLLDFAWVIMRRIIKGQSPFRGDLWHFHHRLLRAGFSEQKVVIFFASASGIFGALALLLNTEGRLIALPAILAFMVLLTAILYSKK